MVDGWNYANLSGQDFTVRVDETYTYEGRDGAVSARDTQVYVDGAAREGFTQGFNWHFLGNVNYVDYPRCTHSWCTSPSPRRVRYAYHPGSRQYVQTVEESDTGPAAALIQTYASHSYYANGLASTVVHGNGVTDRQALNSGMARPDRLWTTGANSNWDSGDHVYDGAGNISAIGNQRFSYDGVSRLTRAQIGTSQVNGGSSLTRTYTYDAFGNLKTKGGLTLPVSSATNRLTGTTYDAAGNITNYNGTLFQYDALGMVTQRTAPNSEAWTFIYTADDERLWTYSDGRPSRWTVRDLDGQVLRDYRQDGATWTVERDYIRANGKLLAAELPGGTRHHFHTDHLGSPRLITNQNGNKVAYHAYYPYGEEATFWNQDSERLKFTGHERDFYEEAGEGDDLDYQHARYCSPQMGRYLTIDPVMQSGRASTLPQLWNRYLYVLGNPMNYIDPRGSDVSIKLTFTGSGWTAEDIEKVTRKVKAFWSSMGVGNAFVFDSAEFNRTNLGWQAGVASITLDSGTSGQSSRDFVAAGEFLNAKGLSRDEQLEAVANAANHEVFAHQFRLGPHAHNDSIAYSLNRGGNVVEEVSGRYGTITDSLAWRDPDTRRSFVEGPLPVHPKDKAEAQRELGPIKLRPPGDGPNRWWKFW